MVYTLTKKENMLLLCIIYLFSHFEGFCFCFQKKERNKEEGEKRNPFGLLFYIILTNTNREAAVVSAEYCGK